MLRDKSTVGLCDSLQCDHCSTQNETAHPPRDGSSCYLMPCAEAQDGNLITCLNKSQFKPPRGLAFCLDKPPEHTYLLQGCYRPFNTRQWLPGGFQENCGVLGGPTGRNNRSTSNGLCSCTLAWLWKSGISLKSSWVKTEEDVPTVHTALQAERKRSQDPLQIIWEQVRTEGATDSWMCIYDSERHCGTESGYGHEPAPSAALTFGSARTDHWWRTIRKEWKLCCEWNPHCPRTRHHLKRSFSIYEWQLQAGFPHRHNNHQKDKLETTSPYKNLIIKLEMILKPTEMFKTTGCECWRDIRALWGTCTLKSQWDTTSNPLEQL